MFVRFPRADLQILRRIGSLVNEKPRYDEEKFEAVYASQGGVSSMLTKDDQRESSSGKAKRLEEITAVPIVWNSYQDIATIDQPFTVRVLDAVDSRDVLTPSQRGTSLSETTIGTLLGQPRYVYSSTLSAGLPTGSRIDSSFISLTPRLLEASTGFETVSLVDYVVAPFSLWRAEEIVFTYEFMVTPYHSFRVAAVTYYGDFSVPIPADCLDQYAVIMDVSSEKNVFRISVPWKYDREMSRVYHGGTGAFLEYAIGMLHLMLVSPMTYSSLVSDVIDFNVYIEAHGVQLKFPGSGLQNLVVETPY